MKTRLLFSLSLSWTVLILTVPGAELSAASHDLTLNNFSIQQERSYSNGVMVSKPKDLDTRIVNLLANEQIRTPEDFSLWLRRHVNYKPDGPDDMWQKANDTLSNRQGDCEDYAFLTSEVMRVLGYLTHILAVTGPGNAHAICTFQDGEDFVWFDNDKIKRIKTSSILGLAEHILKQYNYKSLLELNQETKQWTLVYRKS